MSQFVLAQKLASNNGRTQIAVHTEPHRVVPDVITQIQIFMIRK